MGPAVVPVDDPEDPRLAPFGAVADPERIRERGEFVAEGRRVVATLLDVAPEAVRALVVTPAARAALGTLLERVPEGVSVSEVPGPSVLRALTGVHFHQGCLALARRPPPRDLDELLSTAGSGARLWLALEGVTDPDNVGTLFRTASAFGVDGVYVGGRSASPLYRKALRTSLGSVLRVPFAEHAEAGKEADVWARWGVETVALTPEADALPLDAVVGRAGRRIAVLLGSEERGLERATLEAATYRARIPMAPTLDSLNVAAAGAIALYALRRRWARPPGEGR